MGLLQRKPQETPNDNITLCKRSIINTRNTEISRLRGGSIVRKERAREGDRDKFVALEQHDQGCATGAVSPAAPRTPSSLPHCSGSHLLTLTGEARHVFPILHLNITIMLLHAGTGGRCRGPCREEREGGGPAGHCHVWLLVTQNTGEDGLSTCPA